MIKISEAIKKLYIEDGTPIDLEVRFKDDAFPTIKGSDVPSEQMTLHESICEEEQLKFGGCNASSFELTVFNLNSGIKGYEIEPVLITNKTEIPLGVFYVETIEKYAGKDYKKLTAYDKMRYFDVDVKDWYESLTFPISVKDFRDSLCNYVGVKQNDATLIADNIMLTKELDSSSGINGLSLMKQICEISGVFGRMDRYGKFDYLSLESSMLLPADDLYPANDLYPSAGSENSENSFNIPTSLMYKHPLVEDFFTSNIDGVIIVDSEGAEYITENKGNPYYIQDNFAIIGQSYDTITQLATALVKKISNISYRPVNSSKIKGQPYVECGDFISGEVNSYGFETCVFQRDLTGVKALRDSYICKGKELLENDMNGVTAQLQRLNKTTERVKTSVQVTEKGLESEVKRATDAESELSTRIEQTEQQIVLRVDSATGKIVQVSLIGDTGSGTEFKVNADNINLSADDVINLLSGGTINLTGKNITITSDNFTVDSNGNVTANNLKATNGKFQGEIEANSGKIGGDLYIDGKLRARITDTDRYFDLINTNFSVDATTGEQLGSVKICSPVSSTPVIYITEAPLGEKSLRIECDNGVFIGGSALNVSGINADYAQISNCNLFENTELHGAIKDQLGNSHEGIVGTYKNDSFGAVASIVKYKDSNNAALISDGTSYVISLSEFSDRRLKKNVKKSGINSTEKISKIQIKEFDYIDLKFGTHKEAGYIADELQEICPECVHDVPYDGDIYKQVDDKPLIPYLVKAIQELNARVCELEKQLGGR